MISEEQVRERLARLHEELGLAGKRVLVVIPDNTRTAPVDLFFRLLCKLCAGSAARLDFLVALGTHPPLTEEGKLQRLGITGEERERLYSQVGIFNHHGIARKPSPASAGSVRRR